MAKNTTRFDDIETILNRCFDIETKSLDFTNPKPSKKNLYTITQILNYCFDPDTNTFDIKTLGSSSQGEPGTPGAAGTQYPFKGVWTEDTVYEVNDCVQHEGSGYVCVEDHTSDIFADDLAAENWVLLVQKGDGTSYPWQGAWMTATTYSVNDCVQFDGSSYVCMETHTSSVFNDDLMAEKWELLVSQGEQGIQGLQGITGSNVNLAWGTSDTPPGGADDGTLYVVYIP